MDYYFVNGSPSSSSYGSSPFTSIKNSITTTSNSNNNNNNKMKKSKGSSSSKKSKGVMKLSTDPQSVAARERRHRISDKFKILQTLIPGGTKLDTASMLEEAIKYVKFLKTEIWLHQNMINFVDDDPTLYLQASDHLYNPSADIIDVSEQPTHIPDTWFHVQSVQAMPSDVYYTY